MRKFNWNTQVHRQTKPYYTCGSFTAQKLNTQDIDDTIF